MSTATCLKTGHGYLNSRGLQVTSQGIVNEIVERHLSTVSSIINSSLKDRAIEAGWPEKLASVLYVDFSNGSSTIKYPEEYAKEIEDLEYGTPSSPPNSFLRIYQNDEAFNETYENLLVELLFESEVLF